MGVWNALPGTAPYAVRSEPYANIPRAVAAASSAARAAKYFPAYRQTASSAKAPTARP